MYFFCLRAPFSPRPGRQALRSGWRGTTDESRIILEELSPTRKLSSDRPSASQVGGPDKSDYRNLTLRACLPCGLCPNLL
jgi:hypothetical protein